MTPVEYEIHTTLSTYSNKFIKKKKATNTKFLLHLIKYASFATCSRLNNNIDSKSHSEFTMVNPVLVYTNADIDKSKIIEDNRNKVGIYR